MHPNTSHVISKHLLLLCLLLIGNITYATAQTVYVTSTGEKYHKDSCQYLSKSKISTTLEDAKTKGYTACGVCKPAGATAIQKTTSSTTSVQCSGKTKAGARCKRNTTNGRCYQH